MGCLRAVGHAAMLISMANHITQDEQLAATSQAEQARGNLPRRPHRDAGPTQLAVLAPEYYVCRYCKRGDEVCSCD